MKTIRKSMLLMMGTFASMFGFSQINLGLQSTTQAAINSSINAATITRATVATTQLTRSAVDVTTNRAADAAAKTTSTVRKNQQLLAKSGADIKNETMKNADINDGIGISSSQNASTASATTQFSLKADNSANANAQFNGSGIFDKASDGANATTALAEKKISSGLETSKKVEAKTSSGLNATTEEAKGTNAAASGDVRTTSSVKLVKQ